MRTLVNCHELQTPIVSIPVIAVWCGTVWFAGVESRKTSLYDGNTNRKVLFILPFIIGGNSFI